MGGGTLAPVRGAGARWRVALAAALLLALVATALGSPAPAAALTFEVTTGVDSFDGTCNAVHCSLREAITAAEVDTAADTITFTSGVTEIVLDSALPTITRSLTIQGSGVGGVIIQRGPLSAESRILRLSNTVTPAPDPPVAVTLTGLTLASGRLIDGSAGAGILNSGVALTMIDSVISDGQNVNGNGGGYFQAGLAPPAQRTTAVFLRTTIARNTLSGSGSGGGIYLASGDLTLTDSTVSDNEAELGLGGGLYVAGGTTTLTLTASTVSGNRAYTSQGGGLHVAGGTLTLTASTVGDNLAASGGGFYVAGGMVQGSGLDIGDNSSPGGGGGLFVVGGTVRLTGSVVRDNNAQGSGGFSITDGVVDLTNVTISGNTANYYAGLAVGGGATTLRFVTVTGNRTTFSGTAGGVEFGGGTLNVEASIVAGNTADGVAADCIGAYTSGGANVVGTTCVATGPDDLAYGGPLAALLNPTLAVNGGPTRTHALVLGSPALDRAPLAACAAAPPGGAGNLDQRGFPRPQGPLCDAGAYEFAYRTLTIATAGDGSGSVQRAPAGSGTGPFGYPAGTALTLTAQPAPGSRFGGWAVDGVDQPGTGPLPITLTADTVVTATFVAQATLTLTTVGTGTVALAPPGASFVATAQAYDLGTAVTLTPQPGSGQTFVGWTVDGAPQGWPNPLTITMNAAHTVVATFKPTLAFPDVGSGRADFVAIRELASRGTIKGYQDGRYGPDDRVRRDQMAALIARAMPAGPGTPPQTLVPPACLVAGSWDCEVWGNNFSDGAGVDPNLWRNAGTMQHYGVSIGYAGATCTAKQVPSPCFGPGDNVTYAQTISFITRAMKAKGYWVDQPGAPLPYSNVPPAHQLDVRTFHFYTSALGGVPSAPTTTAGWEAGATRGWFARALWAALDSYWKVDRVP